MLIPQAIVQQAGGGGLFAGYALVRDEKAAGTSGGTATSGSFQTRTLNTISFDVGVGVTLNSNQYTLPAGDYFMLARSPHLDNNTSKVKIRNVTDGSDACIGQSWTSDAADTVQTNGWVFGRVSISSAKAFELQYRVTTGGTTASDLGQAANFAVVEVYAEVLILLET